LDRYESVIVMAPITLLLILFVVGGTVLIGISIPLIQGRVGPNGLYGFRVPATLENPDLWYPVNSYSGWWLSGVGAAQIVVATALHFVPDLDVALYASIVGGVVVAGLILSLIQSFRYLNQRMKEKKAVSGRLKETSDSARVPPTDISTRSTPDAG
jgi:hypothetical protein